MKNYKEEIVNRLIRLNHGKVNPNCELLSRIDRAMCWAWENWDDSITFTYHTSFFKPRIPPESFVINWVENEDFEANGYDVEKLIETFN